jgi:competence protein ComEC
MVVSLVSTSAAATLGSLANGINWLMLHSVDPFVSLGISSIRRPEYSNWLAALYAVYYTPLVILAVRLNDWHPLSSLMVKRGRLWLVMVTQVGLLAFLVVHPGSKTSAEGMLRVDFLDVGQGDSALVTMPDGTLFLIDGGGRPEFNRDGDAEEPFERDTRTIGEAVVSEYLWYRGFDSIDYVLATHGDADHIDGLNDIARNFQVRAALVGRTPSADAAYAKLSHTMDSNKVPIVRLGAGDLLRYGRATVEVLWPPLNTSDEATSKNNDSVVLLISFGERALLMTGDIESGTEAKLVQTGRVRADVVKVAHHGSKTSSTAAFVDAVQAKWAIISVGQTSMFEHPDPMVVDRWRAAGAEVMTTGKSGTITLVTDGRDLKIESFVP